MPNYSTTGDVCASGREEAAQGSAGGLSYRSYLTGDNKPNEGKITFWMEGRLLKASKPKKAAPAVKDHKRGVVKGFSKRSRVRMRQKIAMLRRSENPKLITLTYPSEYPAARASKRDLDVFEKRFRRRFIKAGMVWKLEPQKRGAPHFHIMVWGVNKIPLEFLRLWVSKAWYDVVGSGDERHLKAGTRVEDIRSRHGAMAYVAKYLGKEVDAADWHEPGRFWGVIGAENLPWAEAVTVSLNYHDVVQAMRLMRRYMRITARWFSSLAMVCDNPERWFDCIAAMDG